MGKHGQNRLSSREKSANDTSLCHKSHSAANRASEVPSSGLENPEETCIRGESTMKSNLFTFENFSSFRMKFDHLIHQFSEK